jgi:hypothetical protein
MNLVFVVVVFVAVGWLVGLFVTFCLSVTFFLSFE